MDESTPSGVPDKEIRSCLQKEMNEMDTTKLNMEEMEKATGGYVVDNGTGDKYWVVRQDGKVIGPAPTLNNAIDFAKAFGVSATVMTLEEYKNFFGHELKW